MNNLYKTENLKENPIAFRPNYQILELEKTWKVSVWLPGVNKDGIELQVEDEELRLNAIKQAIPADWELIYKENKADSFELKLQLGRAIDASNIQANFKDGILVLELAKAESFKKRLIKVE